MNRLALALIVGLALMDGCWLVPWAVLVGLWTSPAQRRPLLSALSLLALVLLGALVTRTLGRRVAIRRSVQFGVAALGVLVVLICLRLDQFSDIQTSGLDWIGLTALALTLGFGQTSAPALAFALGLFAWWRGVRLGAQNAGFADVESAFRWGIGLLVAFAVWMALTTRPSLLPGLEAQSTPFVVGFFFVSLLTLGLGRLESLRTSRRALPINNQWLGVLVAVAGLVVLLALVVGQLLSFDLLILATRPIFDLLGTIVMLAIYVVAIPVAYLIEWLVYLLLSLLRGNAGQLPPQPPQPADIDQRLQSVTALALSPELLLVLKAFGAATLLAAALFLVARTASRWRLSNADADATDEERDSVWVPGRLKRLLLAWLGRLFRGFRPVTATAVPEVSIGEPEAIDARVASIRDLYRQVLRLGEMAGASRAVATTPLEHLPSLQSSLEPADDLADLTETYLRVRYADAEASPAEAAVARDQLDRLHPRPVPPDEAAPI